MIKCKITIVFQDCLMKHLRVKLLQSSLPYPFPSNNSHPQIVSLKFQNIRISNSISTVRLKYMTTLTGTVVTITPVFTVVPVNFFFFFLVYKRTIKKKMIKNAKWQMSNYREYVFVSKTHYLQILQKKIVSLMEDLTDHPML